MVEMVKFYLLILVLLRPLQVPHHYHGAQAEGRQRLQGVVLLPSLTLTSLLLTCSPLPLP